MRIPDQLLHCRYDVNLTLQVADATFVVCELSSKVTVLVLPPLLEVGVEVVQVLLEVGVEVLVVVVVEGPISKSSLA